MFTGVYCRVLMSAAEGVSEGWNDSDSALVGFNHELKSKNSDAPKNI